MTSPTLVSDWHAGLPTLVGQRAFLREVQREDVSSFVKELTTADVQRFIAPSPKTADEFERFIDWAIRCRIAGTGWDFSVGRIDDAAVVGLIGFTAPRASSSAWHWGFALGSRSWGTGMFTEAARLALGFAFDVIGLEVLEAWVPLPNGRAHRALSKLGAEPQLRRNARAGHGRVGDYLTWTITPSLFRRRLRSTV